MIWGDILTDSLMVGIIAATVSVIMGLVDMVVKRRTNRIEESNQFSQGLRTDIDRKNEEIEDLKNTARDVNITLNSYRVAYWSLFESFSMLRNILRNALSDSGWSNERINEVIPPLPEKPNEHGGNAS